ncbi:hypothetical protein ACHAXR_007510 [Thalassiosira sp. AJA248-18]
MMFALALALFSLVAATDGSPSSTAFTFSPPKHAHHPSSRMVMSKLHMALPSNAKSTVAEIKAESEQLRQEIKVLRKEALRRLGDLHEKLGSSSSSSFVEAEANNGQTSGGTTTEEGLLAAPTPIAFTETKNKSSPKKVRKGYANLMDETRWKVSLSIGREPGTWMPKEWGKSGKRINISFVAEFTPSQLFDRDDFLRGGYTNAKILHVVDSEVKLGPSIDEGQRVYKVKDGGWQVTRGDGPMGTDLLRFFIEVDEKIEHTGGDVYVPKGRVYSSCGYFPFIGDAGAPVKEMYTNELNGIEEQIMKLQKVKDELNPFSLERIKISRELFRLSGDAEQVANKLNFMAVKDPDKRLLRFSKEGDVGLTKEGGVCCQVNKGPVMEYHILGRFSISSAERK